MSKTTVKNNRMRLKNKPKKVQEITEEVTWSELRIGHEKKETELALMEDKTIDEK